MSAAATKFKELGISEMVEDLRLSRLGNHIASALRDMTAKKKRHADGEYNESLSTVSTQMLTCPNQKKCHMWQYINPPG